MHLFVYIYSSKIAIEVTHGLLTQVLKDIIFNKH